MGSAAMMNGRDVRMCAPRNGLLLFSRHAAIQVTVLSDLTSAHLVPSGGVGASLRMPMLMVTSSALIRCLSLPIIGCSPRPRKRPGGSSV